MPPCRPSLFLHASPQLKIQKVKAYFAERTWRACSVTMETGARHAALLLRGWMGIHARVKNSSVSDVKRRRGTFTIVEMPRCRASLPLKDELSHLLSCTHHQVPIFETSNDLRQDKKVIYAYNIVPLCCCERDLLRHISGLFEGGKASTFPILDFILPPGDRQLHSGHLMA